MKTFIIPGRVPSLSTIEVGAVIASDYSGALIDTVGSEALILSSLEPGDIPTFVHRLGGTVKGGHITTSCTPDLDRVAEKLLSDLREQFHTAQCRITFGISAYSVARAPFKGNGARRVAGWIAQTGLALKKQLREEGCSARFVAPQRGLHVLSSVVVEKNHLTARPNSEYVLLFSDSSIDVGKTTAVQEFEEYSFRDYQRPHRDMQVGLLPPKIARMMVNISGVDVDANMLDPFCGLGTILQEALLLGHTHVFGSDLEQKQVDATKENLDWLRKWGQAHIPSENEPDPISIKQCDARTVSTCFSKQLFDAIVTEPYLGPVMSGSASPIAAKTIQDICSLYIDSFREWKKILKKNGRVVIVFPVWIFRDKKIFLPCLEEIQKLGYKNMTIPRELSSLITEKTDRGSIFIAREGQHVGRELFVFELS